MELFLLTLFEDKLVSRGSYGGEVKVRHGLIFIKLWDLAS